MALENKTASEIEAIQTRLSSAIAELQRLKYSPTSPQP